MEVWDWIKRQISFGGIVENVVASLVWAIIGGGFVLLINVYRNDRSKFVGKWDAIINWHPDWARSLFEQTEDVSDPRSVGEISLSYGAGRKKNQYWGLGVFKLKSGDTEYGGIAVKIYDVVTSKPLFQDESPYVKALKLEKFSIDPFIRLSMLPSFKYATQASYYIKIEKSCADRIEGTMMRRKYKEDVVEVGTFVANRVI
jgi:hypothetical protein